MFKIAISGPESTGKTEIARQLAQYFAGQWIPEFAREYIEKLGRTYTYEDVCVIAEQQILEQKSFKNDDSPGFLHGYRATVSIWPKATNVSPKLPALMPML
jgi:nicotinamide riboside kinase